LMLKLAPLKLISLKEEVYCIGIGTAGKETREYVTLTGVTFDGRRDDIEFRS